MCLRRLTHTQRHSRTHWFKVSVSRVSKSVHSATLWLWTLHSEEESSGAWTGAFRRFTMGSFGNVMVWIAGGGALPCFTQPGGGYFCASSSENSSIDISLSYPLFPESSLTRKHCGRRCVFVRSFQSVEAKNTQISGRCAAARNLPKSSFLKDFGVSNPSLFDSAESPEYLFIFD